MTALVAAVEAVAVPVTTMPCMPSLTWLGPLDAPAAVWAVANPERVESASPDAATPAAVKTARRRDNLLESDTIILLFETERFLTGGEKEERVLMRFISSNA